jgi:hypothetical protein
MSKKDSYLINRNKLQLKLKNVSYNDIKISDELIEEVEKRDSIKSKINDYYEIENYDNEHITIKFIRESFFDPKVLFKIKIEINVFYELDNSDEKEIDISDLKEELDNRKEALLSPAIHQSSILISNLTNVNTNGRPLITSPFLKEEER